MYFERSGSLGSARRPRLPPSARGLAALALGRRRPSARATGSPSVTRKRTDTPGSAARGRLAHELGEVALDPGARELVGHADLEHVALQCERPRGREPGAEDHRREVVADAVGDRGPEEVRCGGIYGHGNARPRRKRVSIDAVRTGRGERMLARRRRVAADRAAKSRSLRTLLRFPQRRPQAVCTLGVRNPTARAGSRRAPRRRAPGLSTPRRAARPATRATATLPLSRPADPTSSREAHLPAQQAQARKDARLPQAHEHARGPRHPQAPPPARPQAPLGLGRGGHRYAQPAPLALG